LVKTSKRLIMTAALFLYLLIGAITGFLSGLIGIGGGVIGVPGLVYGFGAVGIPSSVLMHLAEGTSIAAIMFNMLSAVATHHKNKKIIWEMVKQLTPGIIIGCIAGVGIASFLPSRILKIIFGLFMLIIAMQLLLARKRHESHNAPPTLFVQRLGGILVGLLSGLMGIGGGVVAIPLLLRFGLPMHNAAATSTTCALIASIIGTISFAITGIHAAELPAGSTGFVYWPAAIAMAVVGVILVPIGAKIARRLSSTALKRVFAVLLLIVGIDMLAR
jgi:uncharacterized membrane protein YfcA